MMKRGLKQIGKRVAAFLAGFAAVSSLFACPVFAAGGVYVSDTYIEIAEGETASVSVTADNAVGTYSVSADGPISAGGGDWLEDESATIEITGTGVGTGYVTITLDDVATYDGEDLSGTTLTVEVVVGEPEGGYSGGDKGKEDREEIEKETDEEEEKTEEETTRASKKVNKRSVTINKRNYTLLNDLKGVKIPAGFETQEKTWNGEKILVLTYGDELVFYVLQREDDGKVVFREYDEASKTFIAPRTIVQNKALYYVLDAKAGETPSKHLTQKDLAVNDFEVKGYVADDKALSDLVYLRILVDGKEGIYTFDQKEGSLQRCLTLDPESEKELRSELEKTQSELQKAQKNLQLYKILLVVAGVLVIGLVIALILVLVRKKNRPRFEDLYPVGEELEPKAPADIAETQILKEKTETAPGTENSSVAGTTGLGPLNLKPLNLKPLNSEAVNSAAPAPEKPAAPAPEKPAATAAERPAATAPERPAASAPERPAATAPEKPAAPAPETAPPQPAQQEPEKPFKPELDIPDLKFSDEEFRNL